MNGHGRLLLFLILFLGALAPSGAAAAGRTRVVAPAGPYTSIPEALAAAEAGDTIAVQGGTHMGPLVVDKSVALVGTDGATLDGQGAGIVLTVAAPRVTVRGFTIRGSGAKLDKEDGGVLFTHAPDCLLTSNWVEDVLFGVTVAQSPRCTLRENIIIGKPLDIARRGDGLRVWESPGTLVEGNHLSTGRDLLLWYSDGTTIRGNIVETGRYGLHFMFNHHTTVEENILSDNSVGMYLMYSDHITITRNSLLANRGPSGYGLGLKDVSDLVATDNLFLDNRVGAYLDNSPLDPTLPNRFEGNSFAFNDIGLAFLPQVKHNTLLGNNFIENGQQFALEGSGTLTGNLWSDRQRGGNYWSDYAGYDADHDGRGDLPYRNESLFERLTDRQPELRLFLLSPAGQAVDLAARAFPIVAPHPRLTDELPLVVPIPPAAAPLPLAPSPWPFRLLALLLLVVGLGLTATTEILPFTKQGAAS